MRVWSSLVFVTICFVSATSGTGSGPIQLKCAPHGPQYYEADPNAKAVCTANDPSQKDAFIYNQTDNYCCIDRTKICAVKQPYNEQKGCTEGDKNSCPDDQGGAFKRTCLNGVCCEQKPAEIKCPNGKAPPTTPCFLKKNTEEPVGYAAALTTGTTGTPLRQFCFNYANNINSNTGLPCDPKPEENCPGDILPVPINGYIEVNVGGCPKSWTFEKATTVTNKVLCCPFVVPKSANFQVFKLATDPLVQKNDNYIKTTCTQNSDCGTGICDEAVIVGQKNYAGEYMKDARSKVCFNHDTAPLKSFGGQGTVMTPDSGYGLMRCDTQGEYHYSRHTAKHDACKDGFCDLSASVGGVSLPVCSTVDVTNACPKISEMDAAKRPIEVNDDPLPFTDPDARKENAGRVTNAITTGHASCSGDDRAFFHAPGKIVSDADNKKNVQLCCVYRREEEIPHKCEESLGFTRRTQIAGSRKNVYCVYNSDCYDIFKEMNTVCRYNNYTTTEKLESDGSDGATTTAAPVLETEAPSAETLKEEADAPNTVARKKRDENADKGTCCQLRANMPDAKCKHDRYTPRLQQPPCKLDKDCEQYGRSACEEGHCCPAAQVNDPNINQYVRLNQHCHNSLDCGGHGRFCDRFTDPSNWKCAWGAVKKTETTCDKTYMCDGEASMKIKAVCVIMNDTATDAYCFESPSFQVATEPPHYANKTYSTVAIVCASLGLLFGIVAIISFLKYRSRHLCDKKKDTKKKGKKDKDETSGATSTGGGTTGG